MKQTKIKGFSSGKGAEFQTGDRVRLNGMEAKVVATKVVAGGNSAIVVRMKDGGKEYTVPSGILDRLEESFLMLSEAEERSGVMVALHPHPRTQKKLALPGGEPPSELHVTLAFLGDQSELKDPDKLKSVVSDWASRTAPIEGKVSGHGLFTAGDAPVTYLSPDLPGLPSARQDLVDSLEKAGMPPSKQHGFSPHMTLDYKDRTKDLPDHGGHKLKFSKASLVIGGDKHTFKFEGRWLREDWAEWDEHRFEMRKLPAGGFHELRMLKGDRPMGRVTFERTPTGVRIHGTPDALYVEKGARRQGVASALMRELERRHPGATIDHGGGERTEAGRRWAESYYGENARYTLDGKPVKESTG